MYELETGRRRLARISGSSIYIQAAVYFCMNQRGSTSIRLHVDKISCTDFESRVVRAREYQSDELSDFEWATSAVMISTLTEW